MRGKSASSRRFGWSRRLMVSAPQVSIDLFLPILASMGVMVSHSSDALVSLRSERCPGINHIYLRALVADGHEAQIDRRYHHIRDEVHVLKVPSLQIEQ